MYTKSNPENISFSEWRRKTMIMLFALVATLATMAQVNPVAVNVTVMPPYTSSLSDYMNIPNKLVITLSHTAIDYPDIDLYLKAAIIGDNGVSAISEVDFKPISPITLQHGGMYVVNVDNISEAFNLQHIVIQGTTLNELVNGAGLPEGMYEICVRAFDYNTGLPLSGEEPSGCSSPFFITNLEPPMFLSPICGDPQINLGPQLVSVSWSKPALSPVGTTYHFEMVEIPENVTIDPNEAFLTSKFPVLYEETLLQTMLLLTVDKVSLNPGYTYVMRVTAEDPSNSTHFRNNGTSEICYFKYELQGLTGNKGEKYIHFVLPPYNHPDSILDANPDKGFHTAWRVEPFDTLKYKDPLDEYPNCAFYIEFFDNEKGQKPILTSFSKKPYFHADPVTENLPFVSGKSYWERVSIINDATNETVLTSDLTAFKYVFNQLSVKMELRSLSGKIEYKFEKDDPGSYPVTNAQIKLVARFMLNDTIYGEKIPIPEDKIPSDIFNSSIPNLTNQPLATGTTASTGNFTLTFNWPENLSLGDLKSDFTYSFEGKEYAGKLMLVLYPILDNPYYSGIDREISFDQNPFNLGTLSTYVYSYKLNAVIYEGYKDAPGIKKSLENKEVFVLRKTKKPGLPAYEGIHFNNYTMITIPPEVTSSGYNVVSKGITKPSKDSNGKDIAVVTFTRLIQNLINDDDYYLWIKGTSLLTAESFRYNITMDESLVGMNNGLSGHLNINGTDFYVPGGNNSVQNNNGQSFTFNTNNIETFSGQNYTLHGNNSGTVQNVGNQYENFQYSENNENFSQFTQTGGENFFMPGFNFGTDKISVSSGIFSDISNYSFTVQTAFTLVTSQPPMSAISGRIVYEFPAKAGNSRPLNNRKISLISCLVSDEPGDASKMIKTDYNAKYPQAFPGTFILFTSQTDAAGNFNFQFPNILPIHPVDPTEGQFNISTGKLNRDASWISWESDPGTEFEIVYSPKQVKVKRVLRIVIEDEAGIFLSPCDNIEIEPLKSADVGTLNAEVFSYKLKGGLIDNWTEQSEGSTTLSNGQVVPIINQKSKPIGEAECYVLREKTQIELLGLPIDEGQNIVGSLSDFPTYKIISKSETNTLGEFEFDNLIFRNATAPVLLHFRTKDMKGFFNYEPVTETPKVNKFAKPLYFFKNDYEYSTIQGFSSEMEPRNPTLKGRVISDVNVQKGLNKALVTIKVRLPAQIFYQFDIETDTTGKFDFTPQFNWLCDQKIIDYLEKVDLYVSKEGFHYVENGVNKNEYYNPLPKVNFEKGKQLVLDNILLYSNGSIKGRIINETGTPVDAYVQFLENSGSDNSVETGEMQKTSGNYVIVTQSYVSNGKFQIPAIPGNNRKLVVIPKDVTYFSDTIPVNVLNSGVTDMGDIKVFERQHRIYFYVKKAMAGNFYQISPAIAGAKVNIIGSSNIPPFTSDVDGKVVMNFKNVSESNLTLKVSGPTGSNYVPKSIAFTNIESETPVKLPTVYLESGLTVKGKVLLDGKPTGDAEVYVELSKYSQTDVETNIASDGGKVDSESQYLFTAHTKSDGTFEITTIPPELYNMQITLKAVYKKSILSGMGRSNDKSGSSGNQIQTGGTGLTVTEGHGSATSDEKTIYGESKQVKVPETTGNLTLNLTSFNDMIIKDIWGFPLEITKLEKIPNTNKVKVAGRVKPDGYSPGFDPLEPLNMEVSFVEFQPSDQKIGGIPVGVPVNSKINISSLRKLKLKYAKAFNVDLNTYDNSLFAITRESPTSNNGKFNVTVQIIDNSFQFPSSYLNFEGVNFYFCKSSTFHNTTTFSPVIDVFNSGVQGNGSNIVKFNICNLSGYNSPANDLTFSFINFVTTANKANSFIEGDQITLDATLHATVKNAGEIEVQIGKLVLKNNTIAPISGTTPIMITLKDGGIHNADKEWKFEARDWKVDPKVGGLESKNCILHTGSIDIPYSYFNLRSDFAYLGEPNCTNLTMAGYPVKINPGAKATTGYNASCGSDGAGHWQLIIHPETSGKIPALVENLPNMYGTLQLETVSLLSNGEDVFTIGTGASKMKLYNVVEFKPQVASTLNNGLMLSGIVDFHIPRVKETIGTILTFTYNSTNPVNPTWDPIDVGFQGKGNVLFKINKNDQKFNTAAKTFTTFGTVEEPGKLDPIQVLLTYHSNLLTTDIVESPKATGQLVKIGENNTSLEKVKCSMTADQTDWTPFKFEGDMLGFNGVDPKANKHMVFTVHGEIEANQDKFAAEGIKAEFGGMKISYFKGRLLGSLTLNNIPMGSAIVSGVANILMDSDGWAFYSNASADGVPAPEACTVNMGILIGNYPTGITTDMSNTVLKYAVKKEMPPTFNDGLKGFFMVGGRNLPISGLDIGIDVVVASAYVRVPIAAVDASFYLNLANGKTVLGTSLNGKLVIEFGLDAITCTDLSGSAFAEVYAGGIYDNGSLNFSGGAEFGADLTVSQGIPYLAGCIDAVNISVPTISGGFKFSLNPFDVKMCLGKNCINE
jgi:TANFOR domain-containing protein